MAKYVKAIALLLLVAAPVVFALFIIFGGESDSESDSHIATNNDYTDTNVVNVKPPQVTTLTMGGLSFPSCVRMEVNQFNLENENYQIELLSFARYVYRDWATGTNFVDHDAIARQNVDIIVDTIETLLPKADLYTFIDADPELNRADFFGSVLSALEAPDGTLPFITDSFGLQSLTSMNDPERLFEYQEELRDDVAEYTSVEDEMHISIRPETGIGINAESPHQEVAWGFVRRFILPTRFALGIPLRIDLFETQMEQFMMEDEVVTLREIIENAVSP